MPLCERETSLEQPLQQTLLFNLAVESRIAFQEATPLPAGQWRQEPDVRIWEGALSLDPHARPETIYSIATKNWWYCKPGGGQYLFNCEAGQFEVRDGREIVFSRAAGVPDEKVRVFLLGSSMGALLHQRGHVPIHGGAVAFSGGAMVITGLSGAGKSSAVSALVERGHSFLADDVSAVDLRDKAPWVLPAYPQRKLCGDACAALGVETAGLPVIDERRLKYALRGSERWHAEPLPLRWLVELVGSKNHSGPPVVSRIKGHASLQMLLRSLYRPYQQLSGGAQPEQILQLVYMAKVVPVYRVTRAAGEENSLHLVAKALEDIAAGEE